MIMLVHTGRKHGTWEPPKPSYEGVDELIMPSFHKFNYTIVKFNEEGRPMFDVTRGRLAKRLNISHNGRIMVYTTAIDKESQTKMEGYYSHKNGYKLKHNHYFRVYAP